MCCRYCPRDPPWPYKGLCGEEVPCTVQLHKMGPRTKRLAWGHSSPVVCPFGVHSLRSLGAPKQGQFITGKVGIQKGKALKDTIHQALR